MEAKEHFDHIYPTVDDWPIHRISEHRREFIEEINQYVLDKFMQDNPENLSAILARTAYQERIRVKKDPWRVDPPGEKKFWKKIQNELSAIGAHPNQDFIVAQQRVLLARIIGRYAEEIVGSFVPSTYRFARKFLTAFFKRLLSRRTKQKWGKKEKLYSKLRLFGQLELVRNLARKGVVVLCPTHFSNLDSVLIGYAIDAKVGLPSFAYGAGLNLFNFGPAAYFMNRMGAYRVDRRKKNPIYLETLKSISAIAMTKGVNSLFFPGGTRSRSGHEESRFKLGLLGTTVEAQRMIYEQGQDTKIFIVPVILGYHFVLEAKFLIRQFLSKIGKEQYIGVKDDASSKRKIASLIWKYYNVESDIVLSVGRPMDVVGNFVDDEGQSYDQTGKVLDTKDYFMAKNAVTADSQRERVYTKVLGDSIVKRFQADNVVLSSHIVAYCAFQVYLLRFTQLDLFGILNLPQEELEIAYDYFLTISRRVYDRIKQMAEHNLIRVPDEFFDFDGFIADGFDNLGLYHAKKKPVRKLKNGNIVSEDTELLYYYHNRLDNYGFENLISGRRAITIP